jgi:pyridoxine 5-phosphate synthase
MGRLGVNLDHIATLRQLRGTPYPSLKEAADLVIQAGAEQITVHLREDRRHIQPEDVMVLKKSIRVPLNLEMAVTPAMVKFAKKIKPQWVCLVPEKRQEQTTEGGLQLPVKKADFRRFAQIIQDLKKSKIKVSLFVEPNLKDMQTSFELGADAVELHTGRFAQVTQQKKPSVSQIKKEVQRIEKAARAATELGLHVHAGHGLDFENVRWLAFIKKDASALKSSALIEEFNIGHSLICRSALVGLERATREMCAALHAP